jgi:hypothetical protein
MSIKNIFIKGKFFITAFSLILIQFSFWPVVWHLVFLPKANPNLQGFRVESSVPGNVSISAEQNFYPATFFQFDRPDSSLWAYAAWSIPREGFYSIRVNCDDSGKVIIDDRSIIALKGISALNRGEGYIRLNRGQHFLGVHLNNGPEKGWLKIEVLKPGQTVYQPLDIRELSFLRLGNTDTWLQVVYWAKIICFAGSILFGLLGFCFSGLFKKFSLGKILLVLTSAVLLSLYTVHAHVASLSDFFPAGQVRRHLNVLQGMSIDPWQYRILTHFLLEEIIKIFQGLAIPDSIISSFFFLRCLEGVAIFSVGYLYYRKYGLPAAHALIGISLLAWGMTQSNFQSELYFDVYLDILLYLCAGMVILIDKPLWIIPITAAAAFNRETSGLIPFMLMASYLSIGSGKLKFYEVTKPRMKIITVAFVSLTLYLIISFGLRIVIGPRPYFPDFGPSSNLIMYNLFTVNTWIQLFGMMGILPILAFMSFKKWPRTLKVFFWVIIPIWSLIHMYGSVMAESRIFLVPQTLVFIPGALFLLIQDTLLKQDSPIELTTLK